NGNYVVRSNYWDSGAGAVTFGDGTTGVSGKLTSNNSVSALLDIYLAPEILRDNTNNTFFLNVSEKVWVGSQDYGFPPVTIDTVNDVIIKENASAQTVDLEGIFASGFVSNSLSVTATSSNTSLVPNPVVTYTSPDSIGSLAFTPASNQVGIATITVTVEDGGLDGVLGTTEDNAIIQSTFDVAVLSYLVFTDLRVVDTPTVVPANGEIAELPANRDGVNEWDTYWVEIWVSTQELDSQGIAKVTLDLGYQTDYSSATEINFGPAFTQNQTGTINDLTGMVESLSAETPIADLGINSQVLFARIKFESLIDDQVTLDLPGQSIGPNNLEFQILSPKLDLGNVLNVTPYVAPDIGSSIWANPFDLNDNDIVDFRDLMLFASVYRDKPSESSNDYSWFSDFDQNDRVNFRDLILFATNYRKSKANDPDVYYPSSFPDVWDDSLHVSLEPQSKIKAANLTQAEADQVLEKAIEQVSEQLTAEMSQALSGVEVKVVDLSGTTLGRAVPGTIYLDVNAAGHGWFVDSTPLDHSEFSVDSQLSLIALPESAAAGRVDLWTVILHELGHLMGYEHEAEGVMEETLAPGVRKLAEWEETSDLFFASVQEEAALLPFQA
ncbi:MAG: hypothetical protein P1V19_21225, partial [Gimesia sp.]|nr:hypothetical protein [Gimesia sp.]